MFLDTIRTNIAAVTGAICGAAVAGAIAYVVYEGIPIGPLARIPGVGPVLEEFFGGRVDDVRREALKGYVLESRLAAAEAQLIETQRQLEAGRKAAQGFADLLAAAQAADAERDEREKVDAAEYEKRLTDADRLDAADIDFLMRK